MQRLSDNVRAIHFRAFRGLPDNSFEFKGKSLAILGGNGTGKSAIVDGLEFFFAGHIRRFRGESTQNIDEREATRHQKSVATPKVELHLSQSQEKVTRRWGDTGRLLANRESAITYLKAHPSVEGFILRRYQLLEFIHARDADRYERYIKLLGLATLDDRQRAFIEAERETQQEKTRADEKWVGVSGPLIHEETGRSPTSPSEVLKFCAESAAPFGIVGVPDWDALEKVVRDLGSKRSPETRKQIDRLNAALNRLNRPLPTDLINLCEEMSKTNEGLRELQAGSEEAERAEIVRSGLDHFRSHRDLETCPLCEQPLLVGYEKILELLTKREADLSQFRNLQRQRKEFLDELITGVQRTFDILNEELSDFEFCSTEKGAAAGSCIEQLKGFLDSLKQTRDTDAYDDVASPAMLGSIESTRKSVLTTLTERRDKLVPADAARLETAFSYVQRASKSREELLNTWAALKAADVTVGAASAAQEAFKTAREKAIGTVFQKIAGKVLEYYRFLHPIDSQDDLSECTALKLEPTPRAAAGGLRLAIDFLNLHEDCDPRAYLSEGHLDSLGLCLFLASARLFNPPGSLLVLDDVLTSIDKDHRHRVTNLLLREFGDFQAVITTHDEYWFRQLQGSVTARGEAGKWWFHKIARWTLETGPEGPAYETTWDWIEANLTSGGYRELGGPLRLVLEDFLKRTADKIELKMRYRTDGRYTSGDFDRAGISNELCKKLLASSSWREEDVKENLVFVFGNANLLNYLSHDNPGRLEVPLPEIQDFVKGLKWLIEKCKEAKLIRGPVG